MHLMSFVIAFGSSNLYNLLLLYFTGVSIKEMYSSESSRKRSRSPPNKKLREDEAQMVLRPQREKEQEKAESQMEMEEPAVAADPTMITSIEDAQMEWPFEGSWYKSSKGDWWQFQFGVWWKQVVTVKWERYKDWSQTEEDVVQTGTWQDWSQR